MVVDGTSIGACPCRVDDRPWGLRGVFDHLIDGVEYDGPDPGVGMALPAPLFNVPELFQRDVDSYRLATAAECHLHERGHRPSVRRCAFPNQDFSLKLELLRTHLARSPPHSTTG